MRRKKIEKMNNCEPKTFVCLISGTAAQQGNRRFTIIPEWNKNIEVSWKWNVRNSVKELLRKFFIVISTNKVDKKMTEKKFSIYYHYQNIWKKMRKINTLSKEEYKYLKQKNKMKKNAKNWK